jgi:hypothetical protein
VHLEDGLGSVQADHGNAHFRTIKARLDVESLTGCELHKAIATLTLICNHLPRQDYTCPRCASELMTRKESYRAKGRVAAATEAVA